MGSGKKVGLTDHILSGLDPASGPLAQTFVRTSTKLGSGLLASNVQNLSGLGPSLGRDYPGS
jgi:hypothetical protein